MIEIIRVIIGLLISIGAFLSLVASFGIIRLPDIYTRNHAASKAATLGVLCILLGTFIYFVVEEGHINSRLILGIIFIFLTSPVAGHLISRAAYNTGVKLWEHSVRDDLQQRSKENKTKVNP